MPIARRRRRLSWKNLMVEVALLAPVLVFAAASVVQVAAELSEESPMTSVSIGQ
jgi:hypothetical protein